MALISLDETRELLERLVDTKVSQQVRECLERETYECVEACSRIHAEICDEVGKFRSEALAAIKSLQLGVPRLNRGEERADASFELADEARQLNSLSPKALSDEFHHRVNDHLSMYAHLKELTRSVDEVKKEAEKGFALGAIAERLAALERSIDASPHKVEEPSICSTGGTLLRTEPVTLHKDPCNPSSVLPVVLEPAIHGFDVVLTDHAADAVAQAQTPMNPSCASTCEKEKALVEQCDSLNAGSGDTDPELSKQGVCVRLDTLERQCAAVCTNASKVDKASPNRLCSEASLECAEHSSSSDADDVMPYAPRIPFKIRSSAPSGKETENLTDRVVALEHDVSIMRSQLDQVSADVYNRLLAKIERSDAAWRGLSSQGTVHWSWHVQEASAVSNVMGSYGSASTDYELTRTPTLGASSSVGTSVCVVADATSPERKHLASPDRVHRNLQFLRSDSSEIDVHLVPDSQAADCTLLDACRSFEASLSTTVEPTTCIGNATGSAQSALPMEGWRFRPTTGAAQWNHPNYEPVVSTLPSAFSSTFSPCTEAAMSQEVSSGQVLRQALQSPTLVPKAVCCDEPPPLNSLACAVKMEAHAEAGQAASPSRIQRVAPEERARAMSPQPILPSPPAPGTVHVNVHLYDVGARAKSPETETHVRHVRSESPVRRFAHKAGDAVRLSACPAATLAPVLAHRSPQASSRLPAAPPVNVQGVPAPPTSWHAPAATTGHALSCSPERPRGLSPLPPWAGHGLSPRRVTGTGAVPSRPLSQSPRRQELPVQVLPTRPQMQAQQPPVVQAVHSLSPQARR